MSGIAGVFSSIGRHDLQRILERIRHRGSNGPSIHEGSNSALGAIRLAGAQEEPGPISTPSGERTIVMDGRLTNTRSLLAELDLHSIDGESDAGVALHLFEDLGTRAFGRLEGEFALAISDNAEVILARDRLGVRPLYYGFGDGTLYFGSEIKGVTDFVDIVHEFPPGHFLSSRWGMFPYEPYLPKSILLDGALESAEILSRHLETAVQRVVGTRTEVGVWLSGGLDSSVIAVLARQFTNHLYTFSAGVQGAPDLEYARLVARFIGAEHHERLYTLEEMLAVLDNVVYHLESFDAPLVRSAIANYLLSELSADHVPFVLTGEGGDELFAGYAYQKACDSNLELTLSVQDSIASLHNTALQRVDRSAAAHGTTAAVPFLDPDLVRFALAIPARWKIRGTDSIEKWPLRQGLAHILPDEVIWRGKSKFWEGAGSGEMIAEVAEQEISDEIFLAERDLGHGDRLRSKEELRYFRIFRKLFGDRVPIQEVGRTRQIQP